MQASFGSGKKRIDRHNGMNHEVVVYEDAEVGQYERRYVLSVLEEVPCRYPNQHQSRMDRYQPRNFCTRAQDVSIVRITCLL